MPLPVPALNPLDLAKDTNTVQSPSSAKAAQAAQQFEALMISQMLRDARESSQLDAGDQDSSNQTSTMMEVADQQFALMMARQGGLGLGKLAATQLKPS